MVDVTGVKGGGEQFNASQSCNCVKGNLGSCGSHIITNNSGVEGASRKITAKIIREKVKKFFLDLKNKAMYSTSYGSSMDEELKPSLKQRISDKLSSLKSGFKAKNSAENRSSSVNHDNIGAKAEMEDEPFSEDFFNSSESGRPWTGDPEKRKAYIRHHYRDIMYSLNHRVGSSYRRMGLLGGESDSQIKARYYQLSRECHPDKLPSDISEEEKLRKTKQFQTLSSDYKIIMSVKDLRQEIRDSQQ